jgi:hypothetical protein
LPNRHEGQTQLQLPAARLGEVSMNLVERAWRITHDFTSALPRAQLALVASGDWNPLSPQGFRQLGEVVVDELALTGITASSTRRPTLQRTVDSCGGAAEELSRLGVKGARTKTQSHCASRAFADADSDHRNSNDLLSNIARRFHHHCRPRDSAGRRQLWFICAGLATRRDPGSSGCTEPVREGP